MEHSLADVLADEISFFHQEVKRCEQLVIKNAMKQATDEARGKIPAVIHRKNSMDWVVILRAVDFIKMAKLFSSYGARPTLPIPQTNDTSPGS